MAAEKNIASPNWTDFPLSHPIEFKHILLLCSPVDVLSCRATCSTWHSWFSSSTKFWSKYYSTLCSSIPKVSSYRVGKLTEVPVTGEAAALTQSLKLHRALGEKHPAMHPDTMGLVKEMERLIPVLGPPYIFIKLKVNHPVVAKIVEEILGRYLGCILVDKNDVDTKEEVRMLVFRNLHTRQFAYVDFGHQRVEIDTSDSMVLEGEDKLAEALRLSLESKGQEVSGLQGEKRKRVTSEDVEQPKRMKLEGAEESESDEENEDDYDDESQEKEKSIYIPSESTSPDFPTILELMTIDQPLVQDLLVSKCQIASSLMVPQFDEFLHHPSLLASDKLLVGCDSDGKVASVRPETFSQDGGALLGFIESPMSLRRGNHVEFWGGKDIRNRWPEFAKQLEKIDKKASESNQEKPKGSKLNLPVVIPLSSGEKKSKVGLKDNAGPSSSSSSTVSDLMAILAARGVSVQKK